MLMGMQKRVNIADLTAVLWLVSGNLDFELPPFPELVKNDLLCINYIRYSKSLALSIAIWFRYSNMPVWQNLLTFLPTYYPF